MKKDGVCRFQVQRDGEVLVKLSNQEKTWCWIKEGFEGEQIHEG
jgi:hypothetical protein